MARKPAHARPAPRPNLLVKLDAIQSVDSATAGLLRFCSCNFAVSADGGFWDWDWDCGC